MSFRNTLAIVALFAFSLGLIATPATIDFSSMSIEDSAAWAKDHKMKKDKKAKKEKKPKKEKSCSKEDQDCNDENEKSKKGGKSEKMKGKGKK